MTALLLLQCVQCLRNASAQQAWQAKALNSAVLVLLVPPLAIFAWLLWRASRRPLDE